MSEPPGLLDEAVARFAAVQAYRVTLRASAAADAPFREIIRYAYRKPGWVRMDFVRPYAGMILIYDPTERVVRLWPFGANGPRFSLSPDNRLLASAGGHRVDRSDLGALLAQAVALERKGRSEVLGDELLNGRAVRRLRVTGGNEEMVDEVHRFEFWLDADSLMPLKAEAIDVRGTAVDVVLMDDLELDVALPHRLFVQP